MVIRIALAEDHALLREGVAGLIERESDLELVGTAQDLPSLFDVIERDAPEVVVTDIRMPPTNTDEGIQAARRMRAERPEMGVVVLSHYAEPGYALALLDEGSAGRAYLLKERISEVEQLLRAIREVAQGGSVIDPTVVELLVRRTRQVPSMLDDLTPREHEVLAEMATGKSNAAIATTLVLTERAVEKHTNAIFSKLGLSEAQDLNRRVSAVLMFLSNATSD
jgi:DNA-binding NarL/FixJ family response regulator